MADQAQDFGAGIDDLNRLRSGGYSEDEVSQYQSEESDRLLKGGFSQAEIKDYWGQKDPAKGPYKDFVAKNLGALKEQQKAKREPVDAGVPQIPAEDYMDALAAGWQMGTASLFSAGKMPDIILPENADLAMKTISGIGTLAGDLPAMAAGTVAAAPAGPVVQAGAAMAVPAAMRKLLIDQYTKGEVSSPSEFMSRLGAATWEGIKQGGVGMATAGVGRYVGPIAEGVAGQTAGKIAQTASEIGAMSYAGAAVEGHLPSKDDFAQAAILVGGIHAVASVAPKLMDIYQKTGEKPEEIAAEARQNVQLKQELMAADPDMPKIEVPSQEEQEALGLKPVDEQGKVVEGGGEEPPKPPEEGGPEPLSEDEKAMLSRIGEEQEKPAKTWRERYQQGRINQIDYLEELKNVGAQDTYIKGRLFNAVQDRIRSFVETGTRDFETGEKNGEAINNVLAENEEKNNDPNSQRMVAYWMARRGLDLDARGIESMFENKAQFEAAQRLVKAGEKTYQPYVYRMVEAKNKVLDYYRDAGMLSEESAAKIKEMNENHLALHTIQEADELTGKKSGPGQGIKKIIGSLAKKVDPLTSLYRDTEMMIRTADANVVRQSFLHEMAEEAPNFLREVGVDMKKIDVSAAEIANATGFDPDHGITTFRPETKRVGENEIAIFQDGKMKVYEGQPGVIDALKRLDGDYTAMPVYGKLLRGFSTSLRLGTTLNPAFGFRHYIRSQRAAGLYSQTGMIPYLHPMLAMKDFFTKPETYQNWLYDGGAVSSWDRLDKTYIESQVFQGDKAPTWVGKAWNVTKDVAHLSESFIKLTDNMARYTEYKRAVEQGYDRETAAFLGRNVTADYQRVGAMRSALRTSVAFLNAHIQVTDRALQEATNPIDLRGGTISGGSREGVETRYQPGAVEGKIGFDDARLNFGAKVLAGVTLPSVLIWAATHDDPRMKDRPWWQKMLYLGLPIDNWREAEPLEYSLAPDGLKRTENGKQMINDGPVMKLPVAGEPEIMFGSCVAATMQSLEDHDPAAVKECARQILASSIIMPIPNMLAPIAEQFTNKNFFTGRQVVSYQKEKELPYEQYDQYTSEVAKTLGKIIGYVPLLRDVGSGNKTLESPMVLDNYIKDWTGGGGAYIVSVMDDALRAAGVSDVKVQPEKSWFEAPFVKEFFDHYPNTRAQSIEDFHSAYNEAESARLSLDDEIKKGHIDRANEIVQKYGYLGDEIKGIEIGLRTQNKFIQQTMADTKMTPSDKKKLLTATYYQMLSAASIGNKIIDSYKKGRDTTTTGGQR